MFEEKIFLEKREIGVIRTQKKISGSRVNDSGIIDVTLDMTGVTFPMKWLLETAFTIEGALRPQKIWEFSDYDKTQEGLCAKWTLKNPILRPDGMCVACSGSGKFQASTNRATIAKCPSCKGRGFTTGVWQPETPATPTEGPENV